MSITEEIILLTDEYTGLEYSWMKMGSADCFVDNVLTKNIGNYKYERIFDVADVRWWGIKGDGTDESGALNRMLSDIKTNKKVNEVSFYGLEKGEANLTLNNKQGDEKKIETQAGNSIVVLDKDFAANESVVINIEAFGFESTLGSLLFQNKKGQFAMFLWQRNIISDHSAKTGYFKEVVNELGVVVDHHDSFITVINGGVGQYLKAELKF